MIYVSLVYSGHLFLLVVQKYTLCLVGVFSNHLGLLFVLLG